MTTSTAVKFEIGDRVELVEDYGYFNTGAQGTVERVSPGTIDSIVKVKMDHKNDNGRDSINAFAYRLKKAAAFKKGDRVAFNQDYDGHKIGDTGTVTLAEAPGTVLRGLYVTMDKDKDQVFAFVERWDKLRETKFKVGDRVQNKAGEFVYSKHMGKELEVVALREFASSYDYTVGVVGDDTSRSHADYAETELEAYVAPQPATFNVGDYAEVHGRLDSWDGAIVRIDTLPAGEFSFYKVNVVSGGKNDYTGSAHFTPRQLKAAEKPWEPKFKKGDWVEVTKEHNSVWAGVGQVESEATKGWSDVIVKLATGDRAGRTGGFAEAKLIAAIEPVTFKIGDYVEVVGHNYSNGKKGWVVEPNSHWEGDDYIHITTEKGGKSEYRFDPLNLKAAEEPKPFAIGERVVVDGFGSGSLDGTIGVVTGYESGENGWVQVDATESKNGKFRRFPAENLKKLPKSELPSSAGDLIHVTKYRGETVDLFAMCDGTGDSDAWFAPIEVDGDYWLESQYIEAWSPAKVTVSL